MERLGYLMTLEPGALSDADYQDLIRAYEVLSVDNQAEDIKKFINTVYLPHFKKIGGGKYQISYTVSPVAKELSQRYREYINGLGEVNISAQEIRELRAQLLEAGCSDLEEITGGIVEDNRPKGVFGEAKRDIREMWGNLDRKIINALDGEVGSAFAEIHEKTVMAPLWYGLEVIKGLSSQNGAEAIEQLQENWHELNHGMIVGEYLWASDMITGVAGLPDTVETLGIAIHEKGGLAVIGDLVTGIIGSVIEAGTEFIHGDAKTKGKVIGRLIPDAILAAVGAVEGVKTVKAAKAAKTETGAAIKNGVEAADDLGAAGKLGSTVEGVVGDKVDDVVGSVVKGGGGSLEGSGKIPKPGDSDFIGPLTKSEQHFIYGDGIGPKKRGVLGAHNLEAFDNTLKSTGYSLEDLKVGDPIPHPTVDGVYAQYYRVPAYDGRGNFIGFKDIPEPKTYYDPSIISNSQMLQWGKEAMNNASPIADGGYLIKGTASNGLEFYGYLRDGEITNFFPSVPK